MIECLKLEYAYEDHNLRRIEVLQGVSFHIEKGEKVLLLGINGSGKSTLLRMLNALILPEKGSYRFENETVDKAFLKREGKRFRRRIALQMQDPSSMLFNASVYDEIAFGLKHYGFENVDERVHHWAKTFGVETLLSANPLDLSGGQKQKVLLASLLAIEPEVLLLDEPTAHLDPPSTGWLVEFLEALDITIITATHNLNLGRELATRAIVLGSGSGVIYDGSVEALLDDMPTLMKAQLLHRHRHNHDDATHSHYHLHSWE
jgi:cobalt/nickel transport system ATP-binding protein